MANILRVCVAPNSFSFAAFPIPPCFDTFRTKLLPCLFPDTIKKSNVSIRLEPYETNKDKPSEYTTQGIVPPVKGTVHPIPRLCLSE